VKNIHNIKIKNFPKWYRIKEISPIDFIECCKPLYNCINKKNNSISTEDIFMKRIMTGAYNLSDKKWKTIEKTRLTQKVMEMKIGYFHENLMGKFKGYYTLPNGHKSCCDVMSYDGNVIIEVKNRHNTVKGSEGKHIIALLKKHKEEGKKAIFVQINCPDEKVNRYGDLKKEIDIWTGKEIYAFLSGRESFFKDLEKTVSYVFTKYKTFEELEEILYNSNIYKNVNASKRS
jgi:hypothetical protein